jgi:hypothetical protein
MFAPACATAELAMLGGMAAAGTAGGAGGAGGVGIAADCIWMIGAGDCGGPPKMLPI